MSVTFVHASSESGDHYYFVLDGLVADADALAAITPLCAEDPELLYIEHVERVTR